MAYETLDQMYDNILDPVRGWWDERQLSKVLNVASGSASTVTAGMVGHLDSSGEFLQGIPASGNVLPMFARGGEADNDARAVSGNVSGASGDPAAEVPDQGISCLVGTGAYELATSAHAGTFAVGAVVGGHATNGNVVPVGDTAGVNTATQVGYCTKVATDNYRGTSMVTFVTNVFHV